MSYTVCEAGIRCAHYQPTVALMVGWDEQRESQRARSGRGWNSLRSLPADICWTVEAGIRCAHYQPTVSLMVGWDEQRESQHARYGRGWNSLRSLPAYAQLIM